MEIMVSLSELSNEELIRLSSVSKDEEVLKEIATLLNVDSLKGLIKNEYVTEGVIELVFNKAKAEVNESSAALEIMNAVVANQHTSRNVLRDVYELFSKDADSSNLEAKGNAVAIMESIAWNCNTPADVIRNMVMADDGNTIKDTEISFQILNGVVANHNTDSDIIESLYFSVFKEKGDSFVMWIALNPNTPQTVITDIARSDAMMSKEILFMNARLSTEMMLEILDNAENECSKRFVHFYRYVLRHVEIDSCNLKKLYENFRSYCQKNEVHAEFMYNVVYFLLHKNLTEDLKNTIYKDFEQNKWLKKSRIHYVTLKTLLKRAERNVIISKDELKKLGMGVQ